MGVATGTFQLPNGSPAANGLFQWRLSQDAVLNATNTAAAAFISAQSIVQTWTSSVNILPVTGATGNTVIFSDLFNGFIPSTGVHDDGGSVWSTNASFATDFWYVVLAHPMTQITVSATLNVATVTASFIVGQYNLPAPHTTSLTQVFTVTSCTVSAGANRPVAGFFIAQESSLGGTTGAFSFTGPILPAATQRQTSVVETNIPQTLFSGIALVDNMGSTGVISEQTNVTPYQFEGLGLYTLTAPISATAACIVPKLITGYLDANGNMTSTFAFNDVLNTTVGTNTTYQLTVKDSGGGQIWNETYALSGTAANVNVLLP